MNLEFLQAVALSVANERSIEDLLSRIVSGLADREETVLARIWLVGPGDICKQCPARHECSDRTRCLHLVASDGQPLQATTPRPSRLDGEFRRFPLGVRKVGRVGATGESLLLSDLDSELQWARDPDWVRGEQVRCFAGQPLIFRGDVLGVLAIFSRSRITKSELAMLRSFADSAAAAIANARAFAEVERLRSQLEAENEYLREEVETALSSERIIGQSSAIQKVLQQIELVAPTNSTVLIHGETGTGKELVAREIHRKSSRRNRPLVRVNCATIPKELFESEFFGHVKGSFTGAVRDRGGRFQIADGGTLFLDEVGEIPLSLQAKLLRALQEGEFEPVGDERPRTVDVRIIAATNRDLHSEVTRGRFRADLYYRMSVFPIETPPLREHREDIGLLAAYFVQHIASRLSVPQPRLKKKHVQELETYDWPGNVRELQNVIERSLIAQRGARFSFELASGQVSARSVTQGQRSQPCPDPEPILTAREVRQFERDNIIAALRVCSWKIGGTDGAAALLAMKPTTLSSRIKALGIVRPS